MPVTLCRPARGWVAGQRARAWPPTPGPADIGSPAWARSRQRRGRCGCCASWPASPTRCRWTGSCRACDLPRSTAYHLLSAMVEEGFVVHLRRRAPLRAGGRGVRGGQRLRAPGAAAADRPAAARRRWSTATGQSAHLAVLHGRDVLYVARGARPGPAAAGHRRRRPAARPPDRERPGDPGRAAGRPGPRALPRPRRPSSTGTAPARAPSAPCAPCSPRPGSAATPSRTARSRRASRPSRPPSSTTTRTRSPGVAVTLPRGRRRPAGRDDRGDPAYGGRGQPPPRRPLTGADPPPALGTGPGDPCRRRCRWPTMLRAADHARRHGGGLR